jgi:hypothetical protein
MNTYALTHQKGPGGDDNTPGLLGFVYVAREDAFKTLAKAPKVGVNPGDTAIIVDDHEFLDPTDGWAKVYITLDSNNLKAALVGERDGRGYKIDFEGFHPGNKASTLEFARIVKSLGLIMLVPDADGTFIQVGAEGLPVELAPDYDSARLSAGRRGFTIKGSAYATGLYIYAGDIKVKP